MWRGLEELEQADDFQSYLEAEFPSLANADLNRRGVLKVMAASFALAGLAGCKPDETAIPYVLAPEFVTPGKAKWYATAVLTGG